MLLHYAHVILGLRIVDPTGPNLLIIESDSRIQAALSPFRFGIFFPPHQESKQERRNEEQGSSGFRDSMDIDYPEHPHPPTGEDAAANESGVRNAEAYGDGNSNGSSRGDGVGAGAGAEARRAAVHAEMARVGRLPANSSYALHRTRVLNKILHLMSLQRTVKEDDELELLFASLSL